MKRAAAPKVFRIRSVQDFMNERPEQTAFAQTIANDFDHGEKVINAEAPVKSGKREIAEAFYQITKRPRIAHLWLQSLDRVDDREQLDELAFYGFQHFNTSNKNIVSDLVRRLASLSRNNDTIYVHFNESDYGAGAGQSFAPLFSLLLLNTKAKIICYSATNEELEFGKVKSKHRKFIPNAAYFGAAQYLDNGLAYEAEPFWDEETKQFGYQGIANIQMLVKNQKKIFGVVRFAQKGLLSEVRDSGELEKAARKLGITEVIYVTGATKDRFSWSSDFKQWSADYHEGEYVKVLIIINQTCTRSTEVTFHKYIDFWHEYRNDKTAYNTVAQAALRVAHYNANPNNPHNVRVYTSIDVLEFAAGRITKDQMFRKLSTRVKCDTGSRGRYDYKMEFLDHKPTRADVDAIFATYGIAPKGGQLFPQNLSKNLAYDLAKTWFGPNSQPHSQRNDLDCYLHIDAASPNFPGSWQTYVVAQGLQGKYAVLIPTPKKLKAPVHTTVKSIYS